MALPSSTGRFRQRRISVKQTLQVLRQKDMPNLDREEQQRELQHVETGVEKGEEEERDLQAVMHAADARFRSGKKNVKDVSIPTPDASKTWTDESALYSLKYQFPKDYLKYSATVEDTCGCPYNMDEDDSDFLLKFNADLKQRKTEACSEPEFEIVMYNFERIVEQKQPFLRMDPKQILGYDDIKQLALIPDENDRSRIYQELGKQLGIPMFETLLDNVSTEGSTDGDIVPELRPLRVLLELYGAKIYEHWKFRRLARKGLPITPGLRFEDPTQPQKDDDDPYVCFRRREYRHARKTRRADMQGVMKLRLLDRDFRALQQVLQMVTMRENKRRDELETSWAVFKKRCVIKDVKRSLGIVGEDQELIDHRRREKRRERERKEREKREQMKKERERAANDKKDKIKREKERAKALRQVRLKDKKRRRKGKDGNSLDGSPDIDGSSRKGHRHALQRRVLIDDGPESLAAQLKKQEALQLGEKLAAEKAREASLAAPPPVQPYVKLPSAKIPDLAVTSVDSVLHQKMTGIRKAVSDKLIRRKLQDEGWINYTDDPYNPYLDITDTIESTDKEFPWIKDRSHVPFSSIASSSYVLKNPREIDFSYVFNNSRHYSNNDSEITKINPISGQVVRNDRHNFMPCFYDLAGRDADDIEDAGAFPGADRESFYENNKIDVSEILAKVRHRVGVSGCEWLDRKPISENSDYAGYLDSLLKPDNGNKSAIMEKSDTAKDSTTNSLKRKRVSVYDSTSSAAKRLRSRFLFDDDLEAADVVEPAKLNGVDPQTQHVRFGCMLLSKAYEGMQRIRQHQVEAYQARMRERQKLMLHQKKKLQQKQTSKSSVKKSVPQKPRQRKKKRQAQTQPVSRDQQPASKKRKSPSAKPAAATA